ncbi:sensor histidine kinase [Duganella violaceipulchra]|uniref:Signal transduction histidine kinase n=1 Tax=Duganella violaceipulchra TaxID=2849652 RepID=A0AA41L4P5_9BURK|nr:sensor histidine kinase [Duganella violaceicalia]MBV6323184.1 two-component system sensor protein [Duganella violaceicalia]MCP2010028.1 signal transduction histidine kinase [Duganella violaceicalia]
MTLTLRSRWLLAGALLLALWRPAAAAEHARLLSDYSHRAWTAAQGAPAQIQAITQTRDGWLWLSTPTGLYRFDGLTFERRDQVGGHKLLSTIVLPLYTAPDGALWVGYRFGGASVFKDGQVRHYGAADGFPPGATYCFRRAPDGVMWVATANGLAWLNGGRWVRVGADSGFDPGPKAVWHVLFDRAGTQWVSSAQAVYYRRQGERRYDVASPANVRVASLAAAPDGTVWASNGNDAHYKMSQAAPAAGPPPRPELPGSGMWFDRAGTMWLLSEDRVERMLPDVFPDPRQRVTQEQGLSGMNPQTFFEDRDGTIWIGTINGLDQFRRNRVTPLPSRLEMATPALYAERDGKVRASNDNADAWLLDADGRQYEHTAHAYATAATARDGRPAYGTDHGIWLPGPRGGQLIAAPPAALRDALAMRALAQDGGGDWWASYVNLGLYRLHDGNWRPVSDARLPAARVLTMRADQRGRVWIGYVGNRIALIDGADVRVLGTAQGLAIGNVQSLFERNGHLWVAGELGAALYDGQRFVPLRLADGHALRGISGLVETAGGELWLHGHDGAFRIPAAQLAGFLRSGAAAGYELLGVDDGLTGAVQPTGPFPSMVEASDGKLWLSSHSGAVLIAPGQIPRDATPPPVELRAMESNGQAYPVDAPLTLPQGANNLHLSFSALGLAMPARIAFRYRLQGLDRDWQAAGGRREAFYTNLGPGQYRFQVIAANKDGVWNNEGATLDVTIPPTFVQSLWFKLLCALALAAALGLAWRWRLAQMARLIEARHVERLGERERIARALHDTFLQEAQGTILMMQLAMEQVPPALPARAAMERGIGYIEQALIEGRDEVRGLRSPLRDDETLGQSLERFGQRLAAGLSASFRLEQKGAPYALPVITGDEVFSIGREAICNAFRHAQASEIVVELDYGVKRLTLLVRDNGKGIAADTLAQGGRSGHWGLVGMRERAARIGAVLEMGNQDQGGAFLRLTVPAMYASA